MMNTRTLFPMLDQLMTVDRELERAFGAAAPRARNGRQAHAWIPPMDLAERADAYLVALDLPGVPTESVDVSYENGVLQVAGTKPSSFPVQEEREGDSPRVLGVERASGRFVRAVHLPVAVDLDRIEARYENGVLWITVPKDESAKPRRIPGRGAGGQQQGRIEG